jgi:hypothetical protein
VRTFREYGSHRSALLIQATCRIWAYEGEGSFDAGLMVGASVDRRRPSG